MFVTHSVLHFLVPDLHVLILFAAHVLSREISAVDSGSFRRSAKLANLKFGKALIVQDRGLSVESIE